jgi:hypothetical protein
VRRKGTRETGGNKRVYQSSQRAITKPSSPSLPLSPLPVEQSVPSLVPGPEHHLALIEEQHRVVHLSLAEQPLQVLGKREEGKEGEGRRGRGKGER